MSFQTPVLFLVFNRPDTTIQVFEKIREQKPKRLYIAADGARAGNVNDARKCTEVLEIVNGIDWDCEVKTLFRERNLGCKIAVSEAITWFFENEEMGIILEDDCLPDATFFPYCAELLHKYKDDEKIAGISGSNLLNYKPIDGASYFLSKYVHIWGWASWRRVWKNYDVEMKDWPALRNGNFLKALADGNPYFVGYWKNIFDKTYGSKIDTWDYQFHFSYLKENMFCCVPKINLVSNIGFDQDATHTFDENHPANKLKTKEMAFPIKHISSLERETNFDKSFDKIIFKLNLKNWLIQTLSSLKKRIIKSHIRTP